MTIVDDEDWPWSDEVETFNLADEPHQFVSAANPVATYSFTRCAGDEVKVKVRHAQRARLDRLGEADDEDRALRGRRLLDGCPQGRDRSTIYLHRAGWPGHRRSR